jgi:hypothetical protein
MTLEARYSSNNGMGYEEKLNASAKVQIYLGYESFKRRIKACKKISMCVAASQVHLLHRLKCTKSSCK